MTDYNRLNWTKPDQNYADGNHLFCVPTILRTNKWIYMKCLTFSAAILGFSKLVVRIAIIGYPLNGISFSRAQHLPVIDKGLLCALLWLSGSLLWELLQCSVDRSGVTTESRTQSLLEKLFVSKSKQWDEIYKVRPSVRDGVWAMSTRHGMSVRHNRSPNDWFWRNPWNL